MVLDHHININQYAPCALKVLPASPSERLSHLLKDIKPEQKPIDLCLREPHHSVPAFIGPILTENLTDFNRYPPIRGTQDLRAAICQWLKQRYKIAKIIHEVMMILPLSGTREALFYALFEAKHQKPQKGNHPFVFTPNLYYQTYAAAAKMAGCQLVTTPIGESHNVQTGLPNLDTIDPKYLDNTLAIYLAAPSNPQGHNASHKYWQTLINLARKHNFFIFADEYYSEIYRHTPPIGALQVAHDTGSLDKVITFHSLSKRSNLAGLRFGFMAEDSDFINVLGRFRNMAAPQVPLTIQAVAQAAYADETHVIKNRKLHNAKFEIAASALKDILEFEIPESGFFLWLDCNALIPAEQLAQHLWKTAGLHVMPGAYLSADQENARSGFINPCLCKMRLALVDDPSITQEAIGQLKNTLIKLINKPQTCR